MSIVVFTSIHKQWCPVICVNFFHIDIGEEENHTFASILVPFSINN